MLGGSVLAVDFCQPLLDELRTNAGALPVVMVRGDIRHYFSSAGQCPALIVCNSDTLTHLPTFPEAESLVRQCFRDLEYGSRLVLTLKEYFREPDTVQKS